MTVQTKEPATLLVLCLLHGLTYAQAKEWKDPRPPKLAVLPALPIPAPSSYAELRVHRKPQPRHPAATDEDWPGFFGPRRDGRSRETHLAKTWQERGPRLVWEMKRGEGYASPAVVGDRLVFTHRQGDRVFIDCLQATTGQRFWRHAYPCRYRGRYIRNSGPRATPEIRAGRVFVQGVDGKLFCLELTTGRVLWQRDLHAEFRVPDDFFGVVSTPLLLDGLLIQNLGAPDGPCVVAFSQKTGALVWGAGSAWGPSCSSPTHGIVHGAERVFVLAGGDSRPPTGGLLVLDPRNGAVDFQYPFRSRTYESVSASLPIPGDNWVFISSAYGVGSRVLSLTENRGHKELWRSRRLGLQFSNGVMHAGNLYVVDGKSGRPGAVVCIEPKSGKELARTDLLWEDTIDDGGRSRTLPASIGEGSLIHADGAFLGLSDRGHLLWIDASPKGSKILARHWLFTAAESWTPPVISRGLVYVCQNNPERFGKAPARLLCYDLRAQ